MAAKWFSVAVDCADPQRRAEPWRRMTAG